MVNPEKTNFDLMITLFILGYEVRSLFHRPFASSQFHPWSCFELYFINVACCMTCDHLVILRLF